MTLLLATGDARCGSEVTVAKTQSCLTLGSGSPAEGQMLNKKLGGFPAPSQLLEPRDFGEFLDGFSVSVLCHLRSTSVLAFIFFFCFLGPHLQNVEVPRLGVESELQLLAYTTATATPHPSLVRDLCCSSQQCRILNWLNEARDRTRTLMDTMPGS